MTPWELHDWYLECGEETKKIEKQIETLSKQLAKKQGSAGAHNAEEQESISKDNQKLEELRELKNQYEQETNMYLYARDYMALGEMGLVDMENVEDFGGFKVVVSLDNGEIQEEYFKDLKGRIELKNPHLWNTKDPYLYDMKIVTESDEVKTYFALRTIEIRNVSGVNRVCLNGEPVFLHGVLDQGYFPDGIFLPAEPEEYERDVLRMKELGLNMIRKHIKIEPECFYYYCDKHGMLVVQDMVNNNDYAFLRDTAFPTLGMKKRKDTGHGNPRRKQIFKKTHKYSVQ